MANPVKTPWGKLSDRDIIPEKWAIHLEGRITFISYQRPSLMLLIKSLSTLGLFFYLIEVFVVDTLNEGKNPQRPSRILKGSITMM